jgi:hypothetical protein
MGRGNSSARVSKGFGRLRACNWRATGDTSLRESSSPVGVVVSSLLLNRDILERGNCSFVSNFSSTGYFFRSFNEASKASTDHASSSGPSSVTRAEEESGTNRRRPPFRSVLRVSHAWDSFFQGSDKISGLVRRLCRAVPKSSMARAHSSRPKAAESSTCSCTTTWHSLEVQSQAWLPHP